MTVHQTCVGKGRTASTPPKWPCPRDTFSHPMSAKSSDGHPSIRGGFYGNPGFFNEVIDLRNVFSLVKSKGFRVGGSVTCKALAM